MSVPEQQDHVQPAPPEGEPQRSDDPIGRAIIEGTALVTYLWQAPHDVASRARIRQLLTVIKFEHEKAVGKRILDICQEMIVALRATPSPQQVDLLENGFNRMHRLWNHRGRPEHKARLSICA